MAGEARLMSIAVRPDYEGMGIGQQLVTAFCDQFAEWGSTALCLTTDSENNERANPFFLQLGFRLARSYRTREGHALNEYVIDLKNSAPCIMR